LVDFGEAMREVEATAADQRSDGGDPAAIRTIVFGPEVRAIDGRGGLECLRKLSGEAGVAGFFLCAGEVCAGFKISELILDQDHFEADGEIFVSVGFCVEGEGRIPRARLGRGKVVHSRRGGNGICTSRGRTLQTSLTIERVMEIEPESAVKFKNRKRRGRRLILRRRCGHKKKGKDEDKEMRDDAGGRCNWAHELK